MLVQWDQQGNIESVGISRPSNFHAHGRRDALMRAVAPEVMRSCLYVLWMPNNGPVDTVAKAVEYHEELERIRVEHGFEHLRKMLMTVYHTAETTPKMVEDIAYSDAVQAVKHYPPHPGATTGSGAGIPLEESGDMLSEMQRLGVPLLGHFESVIDKNGREIPHAEREGYMVDNVLWRLRDAYPSLRICFEHASTAKAIEFVKADPSGRTVMTVTPQHSLFIAPDFEDGTLGTHLKCMPIVKTREDRAAVLEFITSGDRRAIAGDDTAPHPEKTKAVEFDKAANGCWLPHSIALYAKAFHDAGALDWRFERFMSLNGPDWWGLERPAEDDLLTIERVFSGDIPEPTKVPELEDMVVPLGWTERGPRFHVGWRVAH